jgi:hypothetical protein
MSSVQITQPQPLKVETALNLAYGEAVVEKPRILQNVSPVVYSSLASKIKEISQNNNQTSGTRRDRETEEEEEEKQVSQILRLRTDTALWFVPDFHPVEVVGISADPVSKDVFCTVKIDYSKLLNLEEFDEEKQKTNDGEGDDDKNEEEEEKSESEKEEISTSKKNHAQKSVRMIIVQMTEMRRRFPHLVIDYLLSRTVYQH